jgi:antirestriction protein ArdC
MSRAHEPARPDSGPADPHQEVTNRIIADLEAGTRAWIRPWDDGGIGVRPLRHDGQPYHGVNVLTLWAEAAVRQYAAPVWMTFRQALALGGAVRKGERGVRVIYASRRVQTDDDAPDGAKERSIGFLKSYTVFNLAQIDGLEDRYPAGPVSALDPALRIAAVEAFFAATGAVVGHGGVQAFYAPGPDRIEMPPFETFVDPQSYYAVLGHEMTHWTRHSSRLDRDFGRQRFGDEAYAREELVAELGAAFLCADLGLALEPRPDHAAYLASWLQVLRADKRFIFSAAAHAERAVACLHGLQAPPPD